MPEYDPPMLTHVYACVDVYAQTSSSSAQLLPARFPTTSLQATNRTRSTVLHWFLLFRMLTISLISINYPQPVKRRALYHLIMCPQSATFSTRSDFSANIPF
ncbi:unnamed protein product [Protopolystoma xenopodis]|uniref:Uncharacterized protein n=1 Tax=Protopolystoma xenopodis TaxID=117903 RepID=A0A3S4ZR65_9PLAT|nr:unnamed protein product [Protopolystoma xenopodis]